MTGALGEAAEAAATGEETDEVAGREAAPQTLEAPGAAPSERGAVESAERSAELARQAPLREAATGGVRDEGRESAGAEGPPPQDAGAASTRVPSGPNSSGEQGTSPGSPRASKGAAPSASSEEERGAKAAQGGRGDPVQGRAEGQDGRSGETAGFGGVEAGRRVGQLPAALTRALPAAARGDAGWSQLSAGRAGRWKVRAELVEDGALRLLEAEEGSPAYVKRLMQVSAVLLRGGQFALPAGGSGGHALELEIWVERVAAEGGGEPHLVRQLSSQYPTETQPGEAVVTFNSGVRVRIRLFVER